MERILEVVWNGKDTENELRRTSEQTATNGKNQLETETWWDSTNRDLPSFFKLLF